MWGVGGTGEKICMRTRAVGKRNRFGGGPAKGRLLLGPEKEA